MHAIVIGSGLLGICTAYFLRQNNCAVTVIDAAKGPALSTSFANGGLLTPSMAEPWNAPGLLRDIIKYMGAEDSRLLFRVQALPTLITWGVQFIRYSRLKHFSMNTQYNLNLAQYTLEVMAALRKDIPLTEYDGATSGTIKIFRDNKSFEANLIQARKISKLGIKYQALDVSALIQLEPALKPVKEQMKGGIYYPNDETGDAHLFCKVLAKKSEHDGVNFQYNETVTKINYEKGHIRSIDTINGRIKADIYVICAGANSPIIAKMANIYLPIKPCKGYSLSIPLSGWPGSPKIAIVDNNLHAAITPIGQQLRIAGMAEFGGYDLRINKNRTGNLVRLLHAIYPDFTSFIDCKKIKEWAGLRPVSADGKPIIGLTNKYSNLFLNTGHSHLGWSMAAGSGKILADSICGKPTKVDILNYQYPRNHGH